ncbi:MAG: hypothetical protein B6I20_09505 [Bacteroidetes bacterium 4572_117]|nr:MAG: hypothetical protein B6I20_09505 [Bacteroidetes bacterium 4572_117]
MELFYRKYGQGIPLIIVHGLYGASDNWIPIGKFLAKYFKVFLIDQRNHGRSTHSDVHDYDAMVGDLLKFTKAHDIEKAILIGHSMGGKTAIHFARKYPEKIIKLIVLDIAPKSYLQIAKENIFELDHYSILEAMKAIDFSKINNRNDVGKKLGETIKNEGICQFLLKNIKKDKDKQLGWRINVNALLLNLDKILDKPHIDAGRNSDRIFNLQVLFIRGADSGYVLDADMEAIRKIFPKVVMKTIDNTGHWLHAEQPKKIVSTIMDFLK